MILTGNMRRRRGLTVVAVLVCLVILTLIGTALFKVGLARRSQLRATERGLQAEWLVNSGQQRAIARLAASDDYPGETWTLADPLLSPGNPAAVVTIRVDRPGSSGRMRTIQVQADLHSGDDRRVRYSRRFEAELGRPETGANR